MDPIPFDLTAPDAVANPYPLYRSARERGRVAPTTAGPWLITRHADIETALRHRDLRASSQPDRAAAFPPHLRPRVEKLLEGIRHFLVMHDGPEHARVRGLVNRALHPSAMRAMEPEVVRRTERLVDAILSRAGSAGEFDLIADFATPLPAAIILDMLGLPESHHPRIHEWSLQFSVLWGPTSGDGLDDRLTAVEASVEEMREAFAGWIAERRRAPRGDLLSALVQAEESGRILDDEEIMWNSVLLLLAGHETITDLLGNGLHALLGSRGPGWALVRDGEGLAPMVVEEMLRIDAPFQFAQRVAATDVPFGDEVIPAGASVYVLLAGANHDPTVYPDPETFRLDRAPAQPLAFGLGPHVCPGAVLARLQGTVALETFRRRFRTLELGPGPREWISKWPNRGLRRLPLRFTT